MLRPVGKCLSYFISVVGSSKQPETTRNVKHYFEQWTTSESQQFQVFRNHSNIRKQGTQGNQEKSGQAKTAFTELATILTNNRISNETEAEYWGVTSGRSYRV